MGYLPKLLLFNTNDHVLEKIVVDLHNTVNLSYTSWLCRNIQQNVVAFSTVLDLISKTLLAPTIFGINSTAIFCNQLGELLNNSVGCIFLHWFNNEYDFVLSHEITSLFGLWLLTSIRSRESYQTKFETIFVLVMLKTKRAEHKNCVIVTEGLFSMDGNIPDIPRLIELKKQYNCMLMVDEAHSLGVLGEHGRGVAEYFSIDPGDVDLWMSTLSKTLCGCGGYIAGRRDVVQFLKYGAPGFVFSVGMPPVIAAACTTALKILRREPERVKRVQHISRYFLEYAQSKGLNTGEAQGYAIVPIITGESFFTGFLSARLFQRGIYVMPISFPAVKEGEGRLRFFLSAAQTEENVRRTIDAVIEEMPEAQKMVDRYRAEHPEG